MKTNFIARLNNLWKVSFTFRTFKKMFPAATALSALVLWPFLLLSLILSGFYYLYAFFLKIASVPIDFLTNVIHDEGKEVKHATQAIIYIVGFPFIFMMYILMAFFAINLVLLYFIISVSNYLWTIKGFKLKPFVLEGDCEELPDGRATITETIKAGVFGITTAELYGIGAILLIIGAIPVQELDPARIPLLISGGALFGFAYLFSIVIYLAGISLNGLLAPKKEKQPEVETAKIEEVEEVQPEVVEEPTVEPVEEPVQPEPVEEPKVEEPKQPKEKPEFLKRNKIKRNKLGNKLNLIGVIGGAIVALCICVALILTFLERGFNNPDYVNLCVWDLMFYGGGSLNGINLTSTDVISYFVSIYVLAVTLVAAVIVLSCVLKVITNKGTLIRNLIIYSILLGTCAIVSAGASNSSVTYIGIELIAISFDILLIGASLLEIVLSWKIVETILGYFNVLKIYDRDEELENSTEEATEETPVEAEETVE